MGSRRAPTRLELLARWRPGNQAYIIDDVLDLTSRGPGHQPRVRAETRVRIIRSTGNPEDPEPIYRVEILESRGRHTGYWAIIAGSNLTEAPELGLADRLRSWRR